MSVGRVQYTLIADTGSRDENDRTRYAALRSPRDALLERIRGM